MKYVYMFLIGCLISTTVYGKNTKKYRDFILTDEFTPLTVRQSLLLAGDHLLGMLNPENNYYPYWEITIHPDYNSGMSEGWPAHNIGRWLDAMLRLEDVLGYPIPKKLEEAMLANTKAFFDNPDHIFLNPYKDPFGAKDVRLIWDLHSLRESLLALNSFAKYRDNKWAVSMGNTMISSLNEKLLDDGKWDMSKFKAYGERGNEIIHNLDPSDTHGRMLEALIWFYETTGSEEALKFASRIAKWHLANTTQPDGKINPAGKVDHTHSYLGTLRGLLLYGRLTKQQIYIQRVAEAYRVNVPNIVKPSGYTSHNMAVESFGETTSPGDVVQLALWLYEEGYSEFLDDADRLVRSRILPSQIRVTKPLKPFPHLSGDKAFNLEERVIGAYGGCHYHSPHGSKMPVTDVTSADIHTMIDVYKHIAVSDQNEMTVLLHLNYEDDKIKVDCQRGETGKLTVTLKKAASLSIRVPQWVSSRSVHFVRDNETLPVAIDGNFARFGIIPAKSTITMEYDLPQKITQEKDQGVDYQVYWKGDDIMGISPNTNFFPLFRDIPEGVISKLNNRELILSNVKQVSRLTGKSLAGETIPNPNRTDERYDVGGTDLGIMWSMDNGKIGMVFGDTYGSKFIPQEGGGPTGGPAGTPDTDEKVDNWRSNILAFSTDNDLENGLTISRMLADQDQKAKEIIYSAHDESGNGDFTTIPTAAIRVNGIDYIHYMSIRKWGTPKGWDTNFSSLYYSTDDGNTWERNTKVQFGANSYFAQTSYAVKDDYVYMIGTPSGRTSSAYLARFPKLAIEDMGQYEYWNSQAGWVKNDEKQASVLFEAPVGEISLMYQEKYKKWIAIYFDSEKYALVYRSASEINGAWSKERVLASGHDYPQLYGAFMHPLKNSEDSIYFVMSLWRPYNVFLLKADIELEKLAD